MRAGDGNGHALATLGLKTKRQTQRDVREKTRERGLGCRPGTVECTAVYRERTRLRAPGVNYAAHVFVRMILFQTLNRVEY